MLHLLVCVHCRAALANYRATVRLAREWGRSAVEGEEIESLVRCVLSAPRSRAD